MRGAPPGLPVVSEQRTLTRGLNFTLSTSLGDIDLLGEIPGGGGCRDLQAKAIELKVFETRCLCLSLQQLIRAKRAAGRPKDLEALAELEAIEETAGDSVSDTSGVEVSDTELGGQNVNRPTSCTFRGWVTVPFQVPNLEPEDGSLLKGIQSPNASPSQVK